MDRHAAYYDRYIAGPDIEPDCDDCFYPPDLPGVAIQTIPEWFSYGTEGGPDTEGEDGRGELVLCPICGEEPDGCYCMYDAEVG